ncbi:hypothetical protein [Micropruina sp.]|uniref:hypothetical protein n=1 Tax=Micropruina sp. TaxID=2737536 RepID=UPI0039E3DA62
MAQARHRRRVVAAIADPVALRRDLAGAGELRHRDPDDRDYRRVVVRPGDPAGPGVVGFGTVLAMGSAQPASEGRS